MVLSLLPETMNLLSELIVTEVTLSLWPIYVLISYLLSKFHILIVKSSLPETMNLLS